MFKRLKNIEDNLVEVDNNDNKVGIFKIIKDIKDRGIKINNDDEAVREIRERIKELIDDGIKVNNFDEMKKEIIYHVKKLKEQGSDVKVDEYQINDLINKIFDKTYGKYERKTYIESEIDNFLEKYEYKNIAISYDNNKNKFDTEETTKSLKKLRNKLIDTSKSGRGLKILTNKQMLNRLPILLAQIEASNNSIQLKNEARQILYSLYRSKVLTKTVYNNLIKSI